MSKTLTKAGNQYFALDTYAQEAVRRECEKASVGLGLGLLYHITHETIKAVLSRGGDVATVTASVVEYDQQTRTGHVQRNGEWTRCDNDLAMRLVTAAADSVLANSRHLTPRQKRAIVGGRHVRS